MKTHFTEEDKKKLQERYEEDQERTFLSYMQYYYDEGYKEGYELGKKLAVASTLYKMKMSLEDISKATGLSIDELNKYSDDLM